MNVSWHLRDGALITTRYNVHSDLDRSYIALVDKDDEFIIHASIEQFERLASLLFFAAQELRLMKTSREEAKTLGISAPTDCKTSGASQKIGGAA